MSDRTEYFKEYRRKNRTKRLAYAKKKYKQDRKKRLTYARSHYILNREAILMKLQQTNLTPYGWLCVLHKCIAKWMKKWKLPCMTKDEFTKLFMADPTYIENHTTWAHEGYPVNLTPVIMRKTKKDGCVEGNVSCDIKQNYSWWNEDSVILKDLQNEMDDEQSEKNKEQEDVVRKQVKKRSFRK